MNIALVSSCIPLIDGGYRFIVNDTAHALTQHGHNVETIWLPFVDDANSMASQMVAYRLIDLEHSCDRIVTFRPPAHIVRHSRKIVWFIHHFRAFFDLWGTPEGALPTARMQAHREALLLADNQALRESYRLFANSKTVAARVQKFNGASAQVLYPPVKDPKRFQFREYGDELLFISRIVRHKRQHLAVEAMQYVRTPVRLRVAGPAFDPAYLSELERTVERSNLSERVQICSRWISEDEKASLFSTALANVYAPFDEDSYGYPTVEAAHAAKATVATTDSGGVLEFVRHGENGYVVEPQPEALAEAFDSLWQSRQRTRSMGREALHTIQQLGISWQTVVDRLTS